MLLSVHNVEGVLWEVAAGGADQNLSNAKRANYCYVIWVCYNLVALQHRHARRCKCSFPTEKIYTQQFKRAPWLWLCHNHKINTHSPISHSSVRGLDGNEQQYFNNSWAMDKIMKKHMTGEWRELNRMPENKCLKPSINPFSFPQKPLLSSDKTRAFVSTTLLLFLTKVQPPKQVWTTVNKSTALWFGFTGVYLTNDGWPTAHCYFCG
jgi:hypothetical protein